MAEYVEKADSKSLESALMKNINAANLKQKLAQTINTSMTIRNNANHLEVHVSGPFHTINLERVIGLLCLAIMDKHG